jgi:hypothetical protein
MRLASVCLAVGLALAASPACAQNAKLVQTFENWQVFVHDAPGDKVCFAAAQPKSMEPKTAKRGPVYLYLTTWQKDGVRNEVSVKLGYPIKPDAKTSMVVGTLEFELYPKDDKGFLKDPAEERKLLDAMKKATTVTVKGVSGRGTATVDQYELAGIGAALTELASVCP